MKITHIVLTGGPCGGKTTALAYIKQKLEEKGFIVLISPEAATLCISGGISPIREQVGIDIAQKAITQIAFHLENIWRQTARSMSDNKIVIIHDRGIVDARAYCRKELYESVLAEIGLHSVEVRDSRYDAVFHLTTAALGAKHAYTFENNSARYESVDNAISADQRIIDAWIGHPHFRVIDNSTDFPEKLQRLLKEICSFLGIPVPVEKERKFLVSFDRNDLPHNAQFIDIEQVYLSSVDEDTVVRVRKRGQNGYHVFYQTIKKPTGISGERIEIEKQITESEYLSAIKDIQKDTSVVKKSRICFLYNNQYFELDLFFDNNVLPNDNALLEIEMTNLSDEISFPSWLNVEKEVTDDPFFSNHQISMRIAKKKGDNYDH